MKVKVAQLKTHLSRYLRELEREGGSIEICVRERPVAYLASARTAPESGETAQQQQRLQAVGLKWTPSNVPAEKFEPAPVPAGDGRKNVASVQRMRSERDW
ncbi:MAG: hypothetical protein BWY59_01905 [Verrucomicrobia bacterium ADurb.Bin345]|nr:MAG: hypothetical protein BWY59_01905 [Verrucomicrobia bacterium ADurb.Bin345]